MDNLSKIDELICKGKLKRAVISKEMYEKEFNISGKDLLQQRKALKMKTISGLRSRLIMRYFMR